MDYVHHVLPALKLKLQLLNALLRPSACLSAPTANLMLVLLADPDRLLRETFEPQQLTTNSIFDSNRDNQAVVEVGPRSNFSTAFSTNATSICTSVGLDKVRNNTYCCWLWNCSTPNTAAGGVRHDAQHHQHGDTFEATMVVLLIFQ